MQGFADVADVRIDRFVTRIGNVVHRRMGQDVINETFAALHPLLDQVDLGVILNPLCRLDQSCLLGELVLYTDRETENESLSRLMDFVIPKISLAF